MSRVWAVLAAGFVLTSAGLLVDEPAHLLSVAGIAASLAGVVLARRHGRRADLPSVYGTWTSRCDSCPWVSPVRDGITEAKRDLAAHQDATGHGAAR